MMQPLKYQAVNWIDGMKLSRTHFSQSDAHHADGLRDLGNLLLTDYNYGLIPAVENARSSLEYDLNPHSDRFEVNLRSCNAITRGGVRIFLHPDIGYDQEGEGADGISASLHASDYENQEETHFSVVVIANPFTRIPVGPPDPEETPLRHPYSIPSLKLEIIPSAQVNLKFANGYHFIIGKIIWKDKRFTWDDHYIPPCMVTEAHPDLREAFKEFDTHYNHLRSHCISITRTIYKEENAGRPNYNRSYGKNTARLCREMFSFLNQSAFKFKNTALYTPPIELVREASGLAASLYTTLNLMPEKDKEELLGYYAQWTGIQPIEFLQNLSQMVDLNYNHADLVKSIVPAQKMVRVVAGLWEKLSGLKFIGEDERSLVLGVEKVYKNSRSNSSGFLD